MPNKSMTPTERRSVYLLASIYSMRMMGLFMILPVFSLYAENLGDTQPDHLLIGLAIGIYGLTQALLQIPFGMLSDHFGRKPIITLGLLIFALGSVIAANADTILGIIVGRAIQGGGAVAAAVMALAADLTREEHRTKAMTVIGMTIGISFALSLVLGPLLDSWIGVPGIFWITAGLAFISILVVRFAVPRPLSSGFHRDTEAVPAFFFSVIKNTQLLRLDGGIFMLHMILTASFVALPFALRDYVGLAASSHWIVYLPVMVASLVLMIPIIIIAEKKHKLKQIFIASVAMIALSQFGLMLGYHSLMGLTLSLLLFFITFNVLEGLLPSLIVKFAPIDKKGTAMGVYSTSQFIGAFTGGVLGGGLYGLFGLIGVFATSAFFAIVWLSWAWSMEHPRYFSSYTLTIGKLNQFQARDLEQALKTVVGVMEVAVVTEEAVAYLKVDERKVDYQVIDNLLDGIKGEINHSQTGTADAILETVTASSSTRPSSLPPSGNEVRAVTKEKQH